MLLAIAIIWLVFSVLNGIGGIRLVFALILAAIAFMGIGLILGGCVEVLGGFGIPFYGDGPDDQQNFYGYLMIFVAVVSLAMGIASTRDPNAKKRRKKRNKMMSFRLWQKPKRRTARLIKA